MYLAVMQTNQEVIDDQCFPSGMYSCAGNRKICSNMLLFDKKICYLYVGEVIEEHSVIPL